MIASGFEEFIARLDELPEKLKQTTFLTIATEPEQATIEKAFDSKSQFSCFYTLATSSSDSDKPYLKALNLKKQFKFDNKGDFIDECKQMFENPLNHAFLRREQERTLTLVKSADYDDTYLKQIVKSIKDEIVVAAAVSQCSKEEKDALDSKWGSLNVDKDNASIKTYMEKFCKEYPWSFVAKYYTVNKAKIDALA